MIGYIYRGIPLRLGNPGEQTDGLGKRRGSLALVSHDATAETESTALPSVPRMSAVVFVRNLVSTGQSDRH